MHFPVSGVTCPAWLPAAAAFAVALATTPAGISGAFLLMSFQMFGVGGLLGSYCGARVQKYVSERWIRLFLGVLLTGVAARYTTRFFL
jgi:hypothetical protein